MKKLFFLISFLFISTANFAQNEEVKNLVKENLPEDKYNLLDFSLKGKVKNLVIIVSNCYQNPPAGTYQKSKWFASDYQFDGSGKLSTRGSIDGPLYIPTQYANRDSLTFWDNGKIKSISTLLNSNSMMNYYSFDEQGNLIKRKFINNAGSEFSSTDTYFIENEYNSAKNIIKKTEYQSVSGNDTVAKVISNQHFYEYDSHNNLIKISENNDLYDLAQSIGRPYKKTTIVSEIGYNAKNLPTSETMTADKLLFSSKIEYNANGEKSKITIDTNKYIKTVYFQDHNLISKTIIQFKSGKIETNTYTFELDSKENWISLKYNSTSEPNETILIERKILYYD
ncbi:MAG: hypothetical protein WCJ62_08580 [Flavobacterium sp.]